MKFQNLESTDINQYFEFKNDKIFRTTKKKIYYVFLLIYNDNKNNIIINIYKRSQSYNLNRT